jgi:hypothetical protein
MTLMRLPNLSAIRASYENSMEESIRMFSVGEMYVVSVPTYMYSWGHVTGATITCIFNGFNMPLYGKPDPTKSSVNDVVYRMKSFGLPLDMELRFTPVTVVPNLDGDAAECVIQTGSDYRLYWYQLMADEPVCVERVTK